MDERVIVSSEPFNAETRLDLHEGPITPPGLHYVRSHFAFPDPPAALSVGGAVRAARSVSIAELRARPARTLTVTLECAGNGRSFLTPPAPGEQWGLGAVSTARWTGVPLRSLLEPSGLSGAVVEILHPRLYAVVRSADFQPVCSVIISSWRRPIALICESGHFSRNSYAG